MADRLLPGMHLGALLPTPDQDPPAAPYKETAPTVVICQSCSTPIRSMTGECRCSD